ncbi:ABC transporter permease [Singulisphaera sp. PoT]|uniref:ABC transporter permease n=1 Tax=Singulisphaera sp. PoT TaxID=3411797 RepID=UPI003BF57529
MKEVRQALKSRQFALTFLILLLAAWSASIFGVSFLGDSIDYGSSAVLFYAGFLFALCVATLVIVPFSTFRSIVEERTETTLELLQITALSPAQIVRGKTLSAIVQVLVYYCAIAPFIAFTALLPGFDIVHVTFSLVMLLITALCFSLIALAIGTQARNVTFQTLSSLFVIAMAAGGMMTFFGFMTAAGVGNGLRFDEADTWWGLVLVVFLGLSTGYICEQAAIAQLTFDSDNRSTGIRLATGAQWLFTWIGLITFLVVRQRPPMISSTLTAILTTTAMQITAVGLLFVGSPDSLSRRVSRGLPRSRLLRVLWAPFLPGAARGLLYALTSLVLLAIFMTALLPWFTMSDLLDDPLATRYAIALAAYSVIYLGAGTLLGRLLRRMSQQTYSYQVLALLALANLLLIVVAEVIHFLSRMDTPQLFDVVNPVMTLRSIADADLGSVDAVSCVVVIAVVAIGANMGALWRGIRDIVQDPVRAQIESRSNLAGIIDSPA